MKPVKEQRSLLSRAFFTVVGGCLYVSILMQPACPDDSGPAEAVDGSSSLSLPDSAATPADGGTTSTPDSATTTPLVPQMWVEAVGTYGPANQGCGISTETMLSISGDKIQLAPFGANATALFTVGTTQTEATGTNLIIFDVAGHTCKIVLGSAKLDVGCTNTSGGSCNEAFNKK